MSRNIFTEEFYTSERHAVDILNELYKSKQLLYFEMYESGTFLWMVVPQNEITENILSKVILDINGYVDLNNRSFGAPENGISLSLLVDEYENHVDYNSLIVWDKEIEEFRLTADLIDD